jgi:hypothetical protein
MVDFRICWVAHPPLTSDLLERLQELLSNTLLHVYPAVRHTSLSTIPEDAEFRALYCRFDICIFEDERWAFSSKLENNFLQIRLCGSDLNGSTSPGAACEGDSSDSHMQTHSIAGDQTMTVNNVDYSWWESAFFDPLR